MKFDNLPFRVALFIILAIVATLLCGIIYIAVQQNYRLSANDPQVQISQSVAKMFTDGQDFTPYLPEKKADISQSLATFVIVYNEALEATVSSAVLDGQTPNLPKGVLDSAKAKGQNRVTWEPKPGVRIAAVITRYDKGYVLVGRSLRETEARINSLGEKMILGWFLTIAAAFAGTWFLLNKKSV